MATAGIIIVLVAIILFIFWQAFRDFVTDLAIDLLEIAAAFTRRYTIAAVIVLAIISFLVLTGLFIPWAAYKGVAFGLSALLVYLIWLPAGIILRIFRVTKSTFPAGIKAIASWLCFIGFLGVLYPDFTSNFKVVLIAGLSAGIFSGMTMKVNLLDTLVMPIVVFLLVITGIKYIYPDTYRANTEWLRAAGKAQTTAADRGRARLDAYSMATYGTMLKDVKVAYISRSNKDGKLTLFETNVDLKKDSMFLLANHKSQTLEYGGQSFVRIKLPKANGGFQNGRTILVEADLIKIGARAEIDPELETDDSEGSRTAPSLANVEIMPEGGKVYSLQAGEKTPWIGFKDQTKYQGNISSPNYNFTVYFSDGSTPVKGGPNVVVPMKRHCYYQVKAHSDQFVTVFAKYL